MICPRYIVFDDAPQDRGLACTANQFADALRFPLAAVGVRVVRQHGAGTPTRGGFQVRGWSRSRYNAKRDTVDHVVDDVVKSLTKKNQPNVLIAMSNYLPGEGEYSILTTDPVDGVDRRVK
jgi:hypothetical protein